MKKTYTFQITLDDCSNCDKTAFTYDSIDSLADTITNAIRNNTIYGVTELNFSGEYNDDDIPLLQRVPFVSIWDDDIYLETDCYVNLKTGEVFDIAVVDCDGLEICDKQFIIVDEEEVLVYQDEKGFDCWADLKGEYS